MTYKEKIERIANGKPVYYCSWQVFKTKWKIKSAAKAGENNANIDYCIFGKLSLNTIAFLRAEGFYFKNYNFFFEVRW